MEFSEKYQKEIIENEDIIINAYKNISGEIFELDSKWNHKALENQK